MAAIITFIHYYLSGSVAKTFVFLNYLLSFLRNAFQVNGCLVTFCSAKIDFLYLFQFLVC